VNKKTRSGVAVLGAGYWGQNLVRNFYELHALQAICDNDPSTLDALKKKYPLCRTVADFDEVLADKNIHAVAISLPAELHGRFVRRALLADKDVFVEKPLCLSTEEGRALIALAKERQRILMVGHLLWYHPAVLKLKELVASGELGRIQYIYSNRLNLGKIRREENILWSFAPHDISVILGLLNEMPERIQAQGGNYLHPHIADATVSLLSFPSGVKAHIFVSWLHPFKEQKLVVVGDKKMVVFNDVEKIDKLLLYPHVIDWKNQIPVVQKEEAQPIPYDALEPLRAECLHFLQCVTTRQQPRTDGPEGLRVLEVLQSCQQALEMRGEGQAIKKNIPTHYFAHESAWIDAGVEIGEGTKIWHASHLLEGSRIGKNCNIGQNVVVGPRVIIGEHVKIQNNVSVYEGVTLEDEVFCGPSMVFTNVLNPRSAVPRMHEIKRTLVKKGATLGANCTIICGITIGEYAFIGAGAVVTKDVPDYALVMGNPAQLRGWICACGIKLTVTAQSASCAHCGNFYHKEGNTIRHEHPITRSAGAA